MVVSLLMLGAASADSVHTINLRDDRFSVEQAAQRARHMAP
jgi:hypothetical protein